MRARTRRRQATIQGALGGLPLDLVNQNMAGSPDLHKYQGWARDILNTGVLAIVICAPLGLLIIGARALGQSGSLSPRPAALPSGASVPASTPGGAAPQQPACLRSAACLTSMRQ